MNTKIDYHILVVGGGIGGVAAGIGLANQGFKVTIFEQAKEFGEIGAGIQLGPNAFHAMDQLGVGDQARNIAVYIDHIKMMDSIDEESFLNLSLGEKFQQRFGNPYAVIHRADLHGIFLKKCVEHPNITMLTDTAITGYKNLDDHIEVTSADGTVFNGDYVIGCDGIHSNIRKQMTGGDAAGDTLKLSSHVCYRAVLPIDEMPEDLRWNAATLWAGPKCHLVHYPLQGWKSFNIVATFQADTSKLDTNILGTREEVLENFSGVADKPMSILKKPSTWKRWVLSDRDPIDNWSDDRAILLGDAAHPTHQYYAQGACMAMEDAVCLSRLFGELEADYETVYKDYQKERMTRAYRIVMSSREIGKHIYHPTGALRSMRNEIMRGKSDDEWHDILQWLYGKRGPVNNSV